MVKKSLIVFVLLLACLTGCQKFQPATVVLKDCYADGKILHGTAQITDDGGCSYFIEQGFCYSLFDTVSVTQIYTTTIPLNYSTDSLQFSWTETLPLADTTYYIRAYVKTNAGIAYSKMDSVSTKTPTDE